MITKEITKEEASEFIRTASEFTEYMKGEINEDSKKAILVIAIDEDDSDNDYDASCFVAAGGYIDSLEVAISALLLKEKRLLKNVMKQIVAHQLKTLED